VAQGTEGARSRGGYRLHALRNERPDSWDAVLVCCLTRAISDPRVPSGDARFEVDVFEPRNRRIRASGARAAVATARYCLSNTPVTLNPFSTVAIVITPLAIVPVAEP
jgi:hypothetical protein